ncbi:MAG: acyl-CoA dehydrogenase, partial [Acidimicrobiaceae bacterium]
MAWDFETDPEFQEKLDWIDTFLTEKIEPIDLVFPGLAYHPLEGKLRDLVDPLKQEVRDAGLWACHLGPDLG